jgi:hypothetical protein
VFVSVRTLYENGKRRSAYWIKAQVPVVGWLVITTNARENCTVARLVDDGGRELLAELRYARVVECRGSAGMLIEGREYRRKGRKDAHVDVQQWWCQAPPVETPMIDHEVRVREATKRYMASGELGDSTF